jgi:hypothetical protein
MLELLGMFLREKVFRRESGLSPLPFAGQAQTNLARPLPAIQA